MLADPIYDEIMLLPQTTQQRQHQTTTSTKHQQQQQQRYQNTGRKGKLQLYPIPSRIFYKNRFKSFRDIRPTQRSLFYDKKTGQYTSRDEVNGTLIVIPHGLYFPFLFSFL